MSVIMIFKPTNRETTARLTTRLRHLRAPGARKYTTWLIILALATVLLLMGQSKITEEMDRPLGPTLPPVITATSTPAAVRSSSTPQAVQSAPDPEPLCGGPEQMIILGAGIDRHSIDQDKAGLVDVIRIIRVDFLRADVRVLTIPRDLWVSIPGLEGHTKPEGYFGYPIVDGKVLDQPGDQGRINASYFYGEFYDLPGGGPAILAQTLYQNFGLAVDHYAITDMQTFAEAIDAIGGVDIYVPETLGGFAAGWHHMNGPTALAYSRIRKTDTDWDRIDRQSQLMLALSDQAYKSRNLSALPELANSVLSNTVTDLSKADIASLVCLATKASRDTILTYTIGPEMVTPVGTTYNASVMLPHMEPIRVLVAEFLSEAGKSPIPVTD